VRGTFTYRGRFVRLVPNQLVVEVDEFETADPALRGEVTMTIALADSDVPAATRPAPREAPPVA
jgi:hypothetical protein